MSGAANRAWQLVAEWNCRLALSRRPVAAQVSRLVLDHHKVLASRYSILNVMRPDDGEIGGLKLKPTQACILTLSAYFLIYSPILGILWS